MSVPKPGKAKGSSRPYNIPKDALVLHTVLAAIFGYVWLWHLTKQANEQPIASKYGWFFNYATFLPLTLQFVQWPLCIIADCVRRGKVSCPITNNLSCAIFGMATFVTTMYYGMQLTMGSLEEPKKVPLWLPHMLHTGNSIAALLDLVVCHKVRTFGWRASALMTAVMGGYVLWLPYSAHRNGAFPYPFMEKYTALSWQYAAFAAVLLAGPQVTFLLGRAVSYQLSDKKSPSIFDPAAKHILEKLG